jgi:hypothetical protein
MRSHALKWVALGLLAFVLLLVVSGVTLTARGREEMQRSDEAFHDGDLRTAIFHAKKAALSFVPGAYHVERAYQRLEAIGRGAEAQGDEELARVAWEALRGAVEETNYPGRPVAPAHERAVESLERLRAAREHDAPD